MKPNIQPHPNESVSALMTRIYRHIRRLEASHKPQSHYTSRQQVKHAQPKLYLVK